MSNMIFVSNTAECLQRRPATKVEEINGHSVDYELRNETHFIHPIAGASDRLCRYTEHQVTGAGVMGFHIGCGFDFIQLFQFFIFLNNLRHQPN